MVVVLESFMIQKIKIDRVSDATWECKNQFVSKII